MKLPRRVRLVEVGPRDGLQNEWAMIAVADKVRLVDLLSATGLETIEVTSFVSPRKVPQMADAAQVMARIERRPGVSYPVLVPNRTGLEAALAAGATEVALFTAASESFVERNIGCSIEQSLANFDEVADLARASGVRVRGYLSCVLGCPYEGEIAPAIVSDLAGRLIALGCYEVSLGDTIGVGTPGQVEQLLHAVVKQVPCTNLAVHFHDTYGQALANILVALQQGVTVIDSSVAGLGGCPFAPGATGNVASEDVLYMLNGLGVETGVDLEALQAAGDYISGVLGRPSASRVARARTACAQQSRSEN